MRSCKASAPFDGGTGDSAANGVKRRFFARSSAVIFVPGMRKNYGEGGVILGTATAAHRAGLFFRNSVSRAGFLSVRAKQENTENTHRSQRYLASIFLKQWYRLSDGLEQSRALLRPESGMEKTA
jgi:hypothetical protein